MRLTVHLDMFDRVNPCAYAIVWLDRHTRKWSREGHVGLDLPEWGILIADTGNTLICAPHDKRALCVLVEQNKSVTTSQAKVSLPAMRLTEDGSALLGNGLDRAK